MSEFHLNSSDFNQCEGVLKADSYKDYNDKDKENVRKLRVAAMKREDSTCQATQMTCQSVLKTLSELPLSRASGNNDNYICMHDFKHILEQINHIRHRIKTSESPHSCESTVFNELVQPLAEQIKQLTIKELLNQLDMLPKEERPKLRFQIDIWKSGSVCPFETLAALLNTNGQTTKRTQATKEEEHCIDFLKSIWKKHTGR